MRRVLYVLALLLVTSVASAQNDPHALAERAKAAFDAGDFTGAAKLLEQAYAQKPWPVLLYNLGRAYQQGGDKARAVEAYERYLREDPASNDAGAVRESIRQLNEQIAHDRDLESRAEEERARSQREAEEAERARSAAREADERARHKASGWPWVVTGVGVGAVAAGGVFGILATSAHTSAVNDTSVTQATSDQATAQNFAVVANVLFVAGGVVAIAGAIWGIFDLRVALSHNVRAAMSPTGFALEGTF